MWLYFQNTEKKISLFTIDHIFCSLFGMKLFHIKEFIWEMFCFLKQNLQEHSEKFWLWELSLFITHSMSMVHFSVWLIFLFFNYVFSLWHFTFTFWKALLFKVTYKLYTQWAALGLSGLLKDIAAQSIHGRVSNHPNQKSKHAEVWHFRLMNDDLKYPPLFI